MKIIPLENIKTVRMMNTSLWKRYQKQKQGILDVQLELNDATKINIEMQLKQKTDWDKRTVFILRRCLLRIYGGAKTIKTPKNAL